MGEKGAAMLRGSCKMNYRRAMKGLNNNMGEIGKENYMHMCTYIYICTYECVQGF